MAIRPYNGINGKIHLRHNDISIKDRTACGLQWISKGHVHTYITHQVAPDDNYRLATCKTCIRVYEDNYEGQGL